MKDTKNDDSLMTAKKQHENFMRMAIKLSENNVTKELGGPFGAVIVKDGKVIAKSANKVTTSNDPTAHAEVSAIRLACKKLKTFDLSRCIIYTSCEPCPMCLGAIYWSRIDMIYYGNTKKDAAAINFDDNFIYEELDKPMNRRQLPIRQMLRDEAQQAFKLWEGSPLKTEY
jgi:guanine deaminase